MSYDGSLVLNPMRNSLLALSLGLTAIMAMAAPAVPASVDYMYYMDVFFNRQETGVEASSREKLAAALFQSIDSFPTRPCVVVAGYADKSEGNKKEQMMLSRIRAERVSELLKKYGRTSVKTFLVAQGASQPVFSPGDVRNARVELEMRPCWKDDLGPD